MGCAVLWCRHAGRPYCATTGRFECRGPIPSRDGLSGTTRPFRACTKFVKRWRARACLETIFFTVLIIMRTQKSPQADNYYKSCSQMRLGDNCPCICKPRVQPLVAGRAQCAGAQEELTTDQPNLGSGRKLSVNTS